MPLEVPSTDCLQPEPVNIDLSVVAPCFNEALGLSEFGRRVKDVLAAFPGSSEVVLVDDGSTDDTWAQIQKLAAADSHVRGFRLSRNHGHQLALTAGLSRCRGRRILIIDADLQDPPELLPEMMALMDQGADVVYGQRRIRAGETMFKRLTAYLFYRVLAFLSETPIPRDTGDFRLISRRVMDVWLRMPEQFRFVRGMISWIGFRQVALLYDRAPRLTGKSGWPFIKMCRFAVNAITSFSIKPLRVASWLALGLAGLSFLFMLNLVVAKFYGRPVTGWTSLMVSVLLVGSLQLFVLGIIGEYLGRLFIESKRRPLFVIADTTDDPSEDS